MSESGGLFGEMGATPEFRENPFPMLDMLREHQPCLETPNGMFVLSRYEDVNRLLKGVNGGMRFSDGTPALIPAAPPGAEFDPNDFVLLQDGPDHTRVRKLVGLAFRPKTVDRLRPEMEAVANACVDRAIERGEFDLATDLAQVVPSTIICQMLGVPLEDRAAFTQWTADATHGLAVRFSPEESSAKSGPAIEALLAYFRPLIEERRRNLGDDLLSEMIRAEEGGDRLTFSELLTQSIGLLAAGFETTIGLIGLGMRQLLMNPEQLERLRQHPELIESAVEECLRFDPPIIATLRVVHEEVEFHGRKIAKDTPVAAVIGAANRDPRVFDAPERFDIARNGPAHFSFGAGLHLCLGIHLARLEAQIAIGTVVRRLRKLELESPSIEWSESLFRVPGRMPVRFEV